MEKESILRQVEERLRGITGVIDVWFPSAEEIESMTGFERNAEVNGACGGLMKFTNRGVWATMKRQIIIVLVIQSAIPILEPEKDIVYIVDQNEQVIGEYLTADRVEEFANRTDVCHIGPDFIIYNDRPPVGEPFFVIPEIEFKFLDGIEGVTNVTSGSISTPTDDWIREKRGYTFTKHWTHLIGLDISG